MNASQLNKLLSDYSSLSQADEASLREIEETYPFFALPKILLARHYKLTGSYKFENKLKDTALRVLNRQQLYTILTAEPLSDLTANTNGTESIDDTLTQPILDEDESQVEEEVLTPLEVSSEIEIIELSQESEADKPSTSEFISSIDIQPIEKIEIPQEPKSFTDWLNQVSPGHDEVELQPIESSQVELQIDNTALFFQKEEEIKPVSEEVKPKKDIEDILNRFIELNPSISKPKAEFFNPVKIAQESLEEDEDLVTETLVKIYIKQKNFKKAIRGLEKLSLIYPTKSNFFAAQIREIKETNHIN